MSSEAYRSKDLGRIVIGLEKRVSKSAPWIIVQLCKWNLAEARNHQKLQEVLSNYCNMNLILKNCLPLNDGIVIHGNLMWHLSHCNYRLYYLTSYYIVSRMLLVETCIVLEKLKILKNFMVKLSTFLLLHIPCLVSFSTAFSLDQELQWTQNRCCRLTGTGTALCTMRRSITIIWYIIW